MRKRWAVMISGRGSNLAALLELREEVDIRLVVSSSSQAYGLVRARRAGVPVLLAPLQRENGAPTKKIDWPELSRRLRSHGITHLFLAGFMKVLPKGFVAEWEGRILNLHPSLLPAYPGLRSIERAYEDGADIGVTVHEVNDEVDAGRMICQRHSLNADEVSEYSLGEIEFLVHIDEQRTVKEVARRWRSI